MKIQCVLSRRLHVFSWVIFDNSPYLCDHDSKRDPGHFLSSWKGPHSPSLPPPQPSPPSPPGNHCSDSYHHRLALPVLELHVMESYSMYPCVWLVLLSTVVLRPLLLWCDSIVYSFFLPNAIQLCDYTWLNNNDCLYTIDRQLSCWRGSGAVEKAAMNLLVPGLLWTNASTALR